ncbi:MAG: KamA family radical SAM protein [Candidatus Falkowbacteria bacterium]
MNHKENGCGFGASQAGDIVNIEEPPSCAARRTRTRILNWSVAAESEWKRLLRDSLTGAESIAARFGLDSALIKAVIRQYPARVNPYYLSLIREKNDPIYRQCIPDPAELDDTGGTADPLCEEPENQARPGVPSLLTHRYPDRLLFRISNQCAMYCRFCTRKRKVGDPGKQPTRDAIEEAFQYIEKTPAIRDVVLSGGDPLLLDDAPLERIIRRLWNILSTRPAGIIRLGSRLPVVLPQRVTPELCAILKRYHPIYLNTHFNHPAELTAESRRACALLADAGIPLGNQSVLLKGVNDDPTVMKELVQGLLSMRVRPYYLYQADPVKGTSHFRTSVDSGLEIYRALRGHTSDLAVPTYVIDAPGGGGKIPLLPDYIKAKYSGKVILRNYEDKEFVYPDTADYK